MACPSSFLSCCEENDPDLKLDRDLDPDKPVWSMSCRDDITNPSFLCAFCDFHLSVEHPH